MVDMADMADMMDMVDMVDMMDMVDSTTHSSHQDNARRTILGLAAQYILAKVDWTGFPGCHATPAPLHRCTTPACSAARACLAQGANERAPNNAATCTILNN